MGPDPILARHLEDQKLTVGQTVTARWQDWRGRFAEQAKVVTLKARSVQVELLRAAGSYPAGYRLELPRFCDFERWRRQCGVMVEGRD